MVYAVLIFNADLAETDEADYEEYLQPSTLYVYLGFHQRLTNTCHDRIGREFL